jgi:O-antigen ligase
MTYSTGEGLDSSTEERVTLWQDALEVVKHDPVFGTGFDTYQFMGRVGPYRDTHNYYLKVVVELGFVGLVVFLWLLTVGIKVSWQLFRGARDPSLRAMGCAFLAMLLCTIVVNLFGDRWSYLQVNGFLWILLGLVSRGLLLMKQAREVVDLEPRGVTLAASATSTAFLA